MSDSVINSYVKKSEKFYSLPRYRPYCQKINIDVFGSSLVEHFSQASLLSKEKNIYIIGKIVNSKKSRVSRDALVMGDSIGTKKQMLET